MAKSQISLTVNGKKEEALVEPRTLLIHFLREQLNLYRTAYRLRHHPLRCLHRRSRRQIGEILHGVRGAGEWREYPHDRRHG